MENICVIAQNELAIRKALFHMSCSKKGSVSTNSTNAQIFLIASNEPTLYDLTIREGDYLLINSDVKNIFKNLPKNKATVITYGFNSRACITTSSITSDGLQVCIQRAFLGVDNIVRYPQEFYVKLDYEESPENVLAAATALSVVGIHFHQSE